jgi:aminopeptidase N
MKRRVVLFALMVQLMAFGQFNCQSTKNLGAAQSTTPINYNSRSDTADLVSLKLSINTTGFNNGSQLIGKAEYQIGAHMNFSKLRFDLLGYTVDSIISPSGPLSFSRQGEFLTVNKSASAGDVLLWTIYYHGNSTVDASGWGGVYTQGQPYYNLGVGFAANPHVYGRSLFPCFDNFVEKCTLKEMNITTLNAQVGVSNGLFDRVDTLANGHLVWRWKGITPIPSYLVSMAVSEYHKISWTHDNRPFEIYAETNDTLAVPFGFWYLNDIYDAFVNEFGPYVFEKVGYALTIQGAMEHAGMIHLPKSLAYQGVGEDIIAHELAHMWFGNAITTKTAEDMWINEGFAEFGSHFYEEKVYGRSKYVKTVQNNQALVLKQAATNDGGHLALSGVNQNQTYGTHTYQKGAMVAHNLREFLGDSVFSYAVKQLIASNTFGNYDANSFKESFENSTGVDLDNFWNDWIYTPGYHGVQVELPYGNNTNWSAAEKSIQLHHLSAHVPNSYSPSQSTTPINIYKHSYNNPTTAPPTLAL